MQTENTTGQVSGGPLAVQEIGELPEPAVGFVGDLLVTLKGRNHLRLYNRELRAVTDLRHKGWLHHGLAADPGGRSLVTVSQQGGVTWQALLWQWSAGQVSYVPLARANPLVQVAYSSDGSRLAVADESGLVLVWDALGEHLHAVAVGAPAIAVSFQPGAADRLLVLSERATGGQQLQLWQAGERLAAYRLPEAAAYTNLLASADGSAVVYSNQAFAWLGADGKVLLTGTTADPDTGYRHIALLDNGWLLFCDKGGQLKVCSSERSLLLTDLGAELRGDGHPDNCLLEIAADGSSSVLVATSSDRPAYLFERRQQRGVYLPHFAAAGVHRAGLVSMEVAVSRRGDLLATSSHSRGDERHLNYTRLWAVSGSGNERA